MGERACVSNLAGGSCPNARSYGQVKLGGWDQSQYGYWATNGNLTIARQFNSLVNRAQNDFTAIAAARMREAVAKQVGGVHACA